MCLKFFERDYILSSKYHGHPKIKHYWKTLIFCFNDKLSCCIQELGMLIAMLKLWVESGPMTSSKVNKTGLQPISSTALGLVLKWRWVRGAGF